MTFSQHLLPLLSVPNLLFWATDKNLCFAYCCYAYKAFTFLNDDTVIDRNCSDIAILQCGSSDQFVILLPKSKYFLKQQRISLICRAQILSTYF
jgi:hypothetical protein